MREPDAEWRRSIVERIELAYGIRANDETITRILEYLGRHAGGDAGDEDFRAVLEKDPRTFLRLATVNETYFFREYAHFSLLLNRIVPDLAGRGSPIRLCSCATSVGCEAYSAAMILTEIRDRKGGLPFRIDAFDLNPDNIDAARRGVYGPNAFREDGNRFGYLVDKYVRSHGDGFEVSEALKTAVHFFPHNLMAGMPADGYDCVFFRNALIYLTEEARALILDSIAEALAPGGYFIVGTSETPVVAHPLLMTHFEDDVFYFRKLPATVFRAETKPPAPAVEPEPRHAPEAPPAPMPRRKIDTVHIIDLLKDAERPADESLPADDPLGAAPSGDGGSRFDERCSDEDIDSMLDESLVLAFSLIHAGELQRGRSLIERIEPRYRHEVVFFLHGEIFRYIEGGERAEYCYRESLRENSRFWPAAYRLAEASNADRPYAIERAVRSIERGRTLGYEHFIGGFSPDYYLGLLAKRLEGNAR